MKSEITTLGVEWKRHLESYQYYATIEGVECQIDAPYDDTVCYRIHVYRNHPRYPNATLSAVATGDSMSWEGAVRKAVRYARDIAQWCSGSTTLPYDPALGPADPPQAPGHKPYA